MQKLNLFNLPEYLTFQFIVKRSIFVTLLLFLNGCQPGSSEGVPTELTDEQLASVEENTEETATSDESESLDNSDFEELNRIFSEAIELEPLAFSAESVLSNLSTSDNAQKLSFKEGELQGAEIILPPKEYKEATTISLKVGIDFNTTKFATELALLEEPNTAGGSIVIEIEGSDLVDTALYFAMPFKIATELGLVSVNLLSSDPQKELFIAYLLTSEDSTYSGMIPPQRIVVDPGTEIVKFKFKTDKITKKIAFQPMAVRTLKSVDPSIEAFSELKIESKAINSSSEEVGDSGNVSEDNENSDVDNTAESTEDKVTSDVKAEETITPIIPTITTFTLANAKDDSTNLSTSYNVKTMIIASEVAKYCLKKDNSTPTLDDACFNESAPSSITLDSSSQKVTLWVHSATGNLVSVSDSIPVIPAFSGVTSVNADDTVGTAVVSWTTCGDCKSEHKINLFVSESSPVDTSGTPDHIIEDESISQYTISGLADSTTFFVRATLSDGTTSDSNTEEKSFTTLTPITPVINSFALANSADDNTSQSASYTVKPLISVTDVAKYCLRKDAVTPATDDACFSDSAPTSYTIDSSEQNVTLWVQSSTGNLTSSTDSIPVLLTFSGITSIDDNEFRGAAILNWSSCTECKANHKFLVFVSTSSSIDTNGSPDYTIEDETATNFVLTGLDYKATYYAIVKLSDGTNLDTNTNEISFSTLRHFMGELLQKPTTVMYTETAAGDGKTSYRAAQFNGTGLNPNTYDGTSYTNAGMRFRALVEGYVSHIGFFRVKEGSSTSRDSIATNLDIYDGSDLSSRLLRQTISTTQDQWNYTALDNPLLVSANQEHLVAVPPPTNDAATDSKLISYNNFFDSAKSNNLIGSYVRTSTAVDGDGDGEIGSIGTDANAAPQGFTNHHNPLRDVVFVPKIPTSDSVSDILISAGDPYDRTVGSETYLADNFIIRGGEAYRPSWGGAPCSSSVKDASGNSYSTGDTHLMITHIRAEGENDLYYDFPIANGSYSITIGSVDNNDGSTSKIDIYAEGNKLTSGADGFDVAAVAGEDCKAAEFTQSDVAVTDGELNLKFETIAKAIKLSYIEIRTKYLATKSGDDQTATDGQALGSALEVRVTERDGTTPVQGLNVVFTLLQGDGSLSKKMVATDSNGDASTVLTIGTAATSHVVRAEIPSVGYVMFDTQ